MASERRAPSAWKETVDVRGVGAINIRRGTEADCEAICAVFVSSRQWAYRGLLPEHAVARDRREPLWRAGLAAGSTQRVWIAEHDGRTAGVAAWGPAPDPDLADATGELHALYVDEHAARTGVGSALADAALEEMRKDGYRRAVLWVFTANTRARRFYERRGWVPDGSAKTVVRCGVSLDALRYTFELPSTVLAPW